ncbi:MAG: hypothetical protein U0P45_05950 [Acidimicrobiales bacterium]
MHRLRDLNRRQAVVAAVLVLLLVAHVGVSVARARHVHWVPSGDDALIGLRAHDALGSHRPLVGQPSTSHLYGPKQGTSHPGPIEFYWLAGPIRLLGPSAGMILGAAAFNLAAILIAAWVVLRRAGPGVALWASVLLGLLLWSEGTALLSDPISSNAGGIPLLALAVLAWAVADGDLRLLPLGAVVGSWVAQQHLAIVVPAAALVAFAAVAATVHTSLRWRARRLLRRTDADDDAAVGDLAALPDADGAPEEVEPGPIDASPTARSWPWVVGALATCLVLWSPVLWQQATGHPGNITAVVEYAQQSTAKHLGWGSALRQSVRALGFPPLLLRQDLGGRDFYGGPLSALEVAVAVLSFLAVVAVAVLAWRRRRSLALLGVTALVLALGGTYNGSTIPDSIEAFRVNFYRWTFVVAWLAWIAFGWAGALVVERALARRDRTVPVGLLRWAPALAIVALLVPTVATAATSGKDDQRRDQSGFTTMDAMGQAAREAADGKGRVTLVLRGKSAVLASGPALAMALESAGHPVTAAGVEGRFWGDQRVLDPGEDPGDLIVELVTGRGSVPDGPGRTIARVDMNERLRSTINPLEAQARATPKVVLSPRAEEILARHFQPAQHDYVRGLMAAVARDPAPVLSDEVLLQMVAEGYFEQPAFDQDQVAQLRALLPGRTVNDEDVFELRVLTRDELAQEVPSWAG